MTSMNSYYFEVQKNVTHDVFKNIQMQMQDQEKKEKKRIIGQMTSCLEESTRTHSHVIN